MPHNPEPDIPAIGLILANRRNCLEANDIDDKAVPKAVEDPLGEHHLAVALAL